MRGKSLVATMVLSLLILTSVQAVPWEDNPQHLPALPEKSRGAMPSGCVSDPVGDNFFPGPDIVELCAFFDDQFLFITLSFAGEIEPTPLGNSPEVAIGFVEIDVDREPGTGVPGGLYVGPFCPMAVPGFGADLMVDLFQFDSATNTAPVIDLVSNSILGSAAVIYESDAINISAELSMIGSADGVVHLATVIGNLDNPSDCAPNGEFLISEPLPPEPENDPIFSDRFEDNTFKDCPDCPTMVMIPAGSFVQGSPASEPQSMNFERPQRTVNVSAFAISKTAVTFDEWDACVADGGCTHNPADQGWGRSNRPVIFVSWSDAQQYVSWLSNKTGHNYRLPSESEWEYATRAGTTGRFNTGDCITTEQANFNGAFPATGCPTGIYRGQTLPVGSFSPNAFGLYDTHGNVLEWVQDCWNASYDGAPTDGSAWMTGNCSRAVVRGGSWSDNAWSGRSAARTWYPRGAVTRNNNIGFRVARSVEL